MKTRNAILALLLASAGVLAAGAAVADEGQGLLKKSGCLGCHDWDKKKVGPAYKDIEAKYKGQAGAEDKLAEEVSAGKPPHPKVKASPEDVKKAVHYILTK